jgi:transposase
MSVKRKKYTPTEKAKIALEAIKGELTMAQIVSKYAVHATQVKEWKKKALNVLPDAFSNKNKQVATAHETELSELYEKIGRLNIENDFLKKKSDLFRG